MMYYLKKEYEHFTEDHSHDLWMMIRELQETPSNVHYYNHQRELGNRMLKKYYLTADEKEQEKKNECIRNEA